MKEEKVTLKQVEDALKRRGFKPYNDPLRAPDSSWYRRVPKEVAPLAVDGREQQLLVHVYSSCIFPNGNILDASVVVEVNGGGDSWSRGIVLSGLTYVDVVNDNLFGKAEHVLWKAYHVLEELP